MKIHRAILLFLLVALQANATLSPDAATLMHWIAERQFQNPALASYGAIAQADGPAAIGADGQRYYSVSPYSANLAVVSLLQSGAPDSLNLAERWIDWYLAHLNSQSAPDGVPYNHFYHANGTGETICVKPGDAFLCHYNDATDSAAATFFLVLEAAHHAGMSDSVLNKPQTGRQLEALAGLVLALQQRDGLCYAKWDYRVKYLEDNSEVFAGLSALAHLERDVFNDARRSAFYQNAAVRLRRGILSELYDPKARLFYVAKFENNDRPKLNLNTWYPDTQAQLWPVLFGVVPPKDPRALAAVGAVNGQWNGKTRPDWAQDPQHVNQGWVEAGHAYAAFMMGETNRVQAYLQAVKRYKSKLESGKPQFAGPFGVDDAGWLLQIMVAIKAPMYSQ